MTPFLFSIEFELYIQSEKRFSDHTIIAYQLDLTQFYDFIGVQSVNDLKEVTSKVIRGWLVSLVDDDEVLCSLVWLIPIAVWVPFLTEPPVGGLDRFLTGAFGNIEIAVVRNDFLHGAGGFVCTSFTYTPRLDMLANTVTVSPTLGSRPLSRFTRHISP